MRTSRRFSLILGSVLALMIIYAIQAYQYSPVAGQGSLPATGMGELRRFEGEQQSGRSIAGRGGLRPENR